MNRRQLLAALGATLGVGGAAGYALRSSAPARAPTATATPTVTRTWTATPTAPPTETPSPTPTPTASPTGTPSPTATPTDTPTASPTPSPTPTPTPSPTPTATPTPHPVPKVEIESTHHVADCPDSMENCLYIDGTVTNVRSYPVDARLVARGWHEDDSCENNPPDQPDWGYVPQYEITLAPGEEWTPPEPWTIPLEDFDGCGYRDPQIWPDYLARADE